jgi:hypothetical protein
VEVQVAEEVLPRLQQFQQLAVVQRMVQEAQEEEPEETEVDQVQDQVMQEVIHPRR